MFEWDADKAEANLKKHRIAFEDAALALLALAITARSSHSGEVRMVSVAELRGRLVAVVWTPRAGTIRIISARRSWRSEERAYHQAVSRAASARED